MTTTTKRPLAEMTTGELLAEAMRILTLLEGAAKGDGIRATLTVTKR